MPDYIMKKIIVFVQNFSDELQELLKKLKGQKMLLSKTDNLQDQESVMILENQEITIEKEVK